MKLSLLVFIGWQILLGLLVQAQFDGSFWWMNTDLLKKAEQIRQEKDVKSTVVNNVSKNRTIFRSIALPYGCFAESLVIVIH